MNNKDRLEEFKKVQTLVNKYDFKKYPLYWGDENNKKPLYLDDEDVYFKVLIAMKKSGIELL